MPILAGLIGVLSAFRVPGGLSVERATLVVDLATGIQTQSAPVAIVMDPAILHPMTGADAHLLPQGAHLSRTVLVFTPEKLRTYEEFGDEADVVLRVMGVPPARLTTVRYVVHKSEDWTEAVGHHRCVAVQE